MISKCIKNTMCGVSGLRKGRLALLCLIMFSVSPAVALAQTPMDRSGSKGWFVWLIALGVVLAAVASAFLNPKRSHLD